MATLQRCDSMLKILTSGTIEISRVCRMSRLGCQNALLMSYKTLAHYTPAKFFFPRLLDVQFNCHGREPRKHNIFNENVYGNGGNRASSDE